MNLSQTKERDFFTSLLQGEIQTRFFLPTFPSISLKNHEMETLTTSLQYYYHMCCVRESEKKKERQIFKHELHKRKVEQNRLCMLFQVPKQNQHLSIKKLSIWSLPEPCADPIYKDEREKTLYLIFHRRKKSRKLQNLLNYSPFTSYNYYDISQHSTHFHLVLLREVFWQKKQTLLINWYSIVCQQKEQDHVVLITFLLGRCLIPNSHPPLLLKKKYYLLLWLESKLYYTLLHYLPCPIYHNLKLSLYVCCRADPPH